MIDEGPIKLISAKNKSTLDNIFELEDAQPLITIHEANSVSEPSLPPPHSLPCG